jgi:general secretion pathway protein B
MLLPYRGVHPRKEESEAMSYILDALKKAERERTVKQSPMLLTAHDSQGTHRNYRVPVAMGLLVCAAAAAWFFLPGRTGLQPAPTSPAAVPDQNQAVAENVRKSNQRRAESPVMPLNAVAPSKAGDSRGNASAGPREVRPAPIEKSVPNIEAPSKPLNDGRTLIQPSLNPIGLPLNEPPPLNPPSIPKEPPPALTADTPAPPASVHEAVAKMKLNILVYYDDEAARKVYINGKKYVTGDLVDGLYLVESITPEGVILSYKGEKALLR